MSCQVSVLVLASSFLTISSACPMIDYKYKKIEGCEQSSSNRARLPFKGICFLEKEEKKGNVILIRQHNHCNVF